MSNTTAATAKGGVFLRKKKTGGKIGVLCIGLMLGIAACGTYVFAQPNLRGPFLVSIHVKPFYYTSDDRTGLKAKIAQIVAAPAPQALPATLTVAPAKKTYHHGKGSKMAKPRTFINRLSS
jgi:hypothetical protein